jgi:hypothetical protein
VLECHPSDSRLAFSASYDGQVILWDIGRGKALARWHSADTCPGPGRWSDAVQHVDGKFSPDGSTIAVSDVAGQFSLYSTGPRGRCCGAVDGC